MEIASGENPRKDGIIEIESRLRFVKIKIYNLEIVNSVQLSYHYVEIASGENPRKDGILESAETESVSELLFVKIKIYNLLCEQREVICKWCGDCCSHSSPSQLRANTICGN